MKEVELSEIFNNGSGFPCNFDDTYLATESVAKYKLLYDKKILEDFDKKLEDNKFYLPDNDVKKMIIVGLLTGNIILQGPPGTGKTTLAKIICDLFQCTSEIVTATADWTTYDTIGGLYPDVDADGNEIMVGKNGKLVDAIIKCAEKILNKEIHKTESEQAHWLIIDELNRSEIDRVFGELFTVFGSISDKPRKLNLWFHKNSNLSFVFVPNRFRIIGTMNNIDKNFVNNLSQGLSRRFAFITINPPKENQFEDELKYVKENAIKNIINKSNIIDDSSELENIIENSDFQYVEEQVKKILKSIRYEGEDNLGLNIGTAPIIDVYEMTLLQLYMGMPTPINQESILSAFDLALVDKVLPQTDGFYYERIQKFLEYLKSNYPQFKKCISKLEEIQ